MSDYNLARIGELSSRVEFLEALACAEGHHWIKAADLSTGGVRQVCSRCGKTQVVEPEVKNTEDVAREYFLNALVYEALESFDRASLQHAVNEGYSNASYTFENFWDEYPEAGLTEDELREVFKLALERTK